MKAKPSLMYTSFLIIAFIGVLTIIPSVNVFGSTQNAAIDRLIAKAEKLQSIDLDKTDSLALLIIEKSRIRGDLYSEAKGYYLSATVARLRNHNIEAIVSYKQALRIYRLIDNKYHIHEVNKWLGLCYAHESKYELGKNHLDKSLEYADSLNLFDSKGQILLNIARFYKSKGDYTNSLHACDRALAIKDSIGDYELAWKINSFTGYILLLNNEHKQALELLTKAQQDQNLYKYNQTEIYRLYHYIARINTFLKNYEVALNNLYKTREISKKMANKELGGYFEGLSYVFIGEIFNQLEQFDSSKVYLKLALKNTELGKDMHAVAHNYCFLGDLYYNTAEYDSAMYFYTTSAIIHQKNKEIDRLNWANLGIGKTYFQQGDTKNALKYLLALINEDSQNQDIIAQTSDYLSQIYFKQKNYKKAYDFLKINKYSNEELINEEKIKEITQLEIEHEYKTKQNELELVREHERSMYIAKLKQNRLTIYLTGGGFIAALLISIMIFRSMKHKKKAGEEKEVLLKEIHHRVKNNLQVISSILSLQSKYVSDSKVKVALTESQDRVKSMALIHQMLYQQDRFSEINVKEYISKLCNTIKNSQNGTSKHIKLNIEIENLWFDIDTAVPLGLIVNELLTNCYKYAFPNSTNGNILLEIKQIDAKTYYLKVADNGIGIPENIQIVQPRKTLGLNMVNILTKQLKGKLEIDNINGASFVCIFNELRKTTNH